jgi:hypothetical protein
MEPQCPTCSVAMVTGSIPVAPSPPCGRLLSWVEGDPETGALSGFNALFAWYYPIQAFRCPKCGLVQLYAAKRQ